MSVMDFLAGAQGGAPAGPAVPGGEEAAEAPQGGDDSIALLDDALELIRQAIAVEPDDEDKLTLEKATTLLQQVKASNQKLTDQAMGAGPGVKYLRKAAQASGGGPAY